jgi:6-pyruvoyltetrahydropterin/6-carboxytetrahydropterin synthase
MYEIVEQYGFDATHQIHGVPAAHPCAGVHAHRWLAEIVLVTSKLLPTDGLSEVALLEPVRKYIAEEMDGHHLNDVVLGAATPARLARHLAVWCQENLPAHMTKSLSAVLMAAGDSSRGRYVLPRATSGGNR